jgi:hypothetical protein
VLKNISRISYSTQVRESLSKNYEYEEQRTEVKKENIKLKLTAS